MSDHKSNRGMTSGKGYYIALILCAVAIGITGFVYYRSNNQTEQASLLETEATELPAMIPDDSDIAVLAPEGKELPTVPTTGDSEKATRPTEKKALKTTAPLSGQEISGYSMEALSYNETTRDWRVHNGVDIQAEEGTPVFAAADGVVESAYEDDLMGSTVIIRHDGGYTTQYSGLQKELSVKSGEAVHMGQVIGCAGSTALVETTLGSHIHFGVTYRDKPMDPAEFLSLGK